MLNKLSNHVNNALSEICCGAYESLGMKSMENCDKTACVCVFM